MSDMDLDELYSELSDFAKPAKGDSASPKEQRIIAGFEEIERFFEEHGRLPQHGEDRDIFERIYAVRLDRLRSLPECRELLERRDSHRLLSKVQTKPITTLSREDEAKYHSEPPDDSLPNDDELAAELAAGLAGSDIAQLQHVRSREEIRAAEEIAKRNPCVDFVTFRAQFEVVRQELKSGVRQTVKFKDHAEISRGDLFILDGQTVLVADMGEEFINDYGRPDCRLRVIYDNGTESDLLLRSLQRALNKDKASRRIIKHDLGPLFSGDEQENDQLTGFIYVLRSKSDHPFIVQNHQVLHKIGVTGGDVQKRVANARKDPTFLLADVEIVCSFKLANIDRKKLEIMLHKFFAAARLDVELKDRFGHLMEPQEWFLVPLPAIEDAVERLIQGRIDQYRYDPHLGTVVLRDEP